MTLITRTLDPRTERKLDRLAREVEDLADTLRDFTTEGDEEIAGVAVEMRDLLDEISYDFDVPEFRRNQARDLVRRVDKEIRS